MSTSNGQRQLPPGHFVPPTPPQASAPTATPVANPMAAAMQALLKKKLAAMPSDHPLADVAKALASGTQLPTDAEGRMMKALQAATVDANIGEKASVALQAASTTAGDVIQLRAEIAHLQTSIVAQRAEMAALVAGLPEKMTALIRPVLEALPQQVQDAVNKALSSSAA